MARKSKYIDKVCIIDRKICSSRLKTRRLTKYNFVLDITGDKHLKTISLITAEGNELTLKSSTMSFHKNIKIAEDYSERDFMEYMLNWVGKSDN